MAFNLTSTVYSELYIPNRRLSEKKKINSKLLQSMTRRGFRIITWNRMKMNFEHLGMQIISVRTPGDYWSNLLYKVKMEIYDWRSIELCPAQDIARQSA